MNSKRELFLFLISVVSMIAVLIGCVSGPPPRTVMVDIKANTDRLTKDDAYNKVTMVLVDRGFDIKMGNKDLGLITTEFKKYGSYGDKTPFDFYLQIKTKVQERPDGKISIVMTPLVKESNRLNAAAFTETQLTMYNEEEQKKLKNNALFQTQLKGQLLFMNVVQDVATLCGLGIEQLEQNTQLIQQ